MGGNDLGQTKGTAANTGINCARREEQPRLPQQQPRLDMIKGTNSAGAGAGTSVGPDSGRTPTGTVRIRTRGDHDTASRNQAPPVPYVDLDLQYDLLVNVYNIDIIHQ